MNSSIEWIVTFVIVIVWIKLLFGEQIEKEGKADK